MKIISDLILFALFFLSTFFLSAAPTTQVRQKVSFNKGWKFILGDNPLYRDTTYNDSSWRKLNLPHDWSIEGKIDKSIGGPGGFFPIGIGWYRKTFLLPESMNGKQVVIQFDGIYMNSEVWINGHFLGRYPYGFTTFQYDLTEYLKTGKGEKNTIAVRVDNSLKESTRWYSGLGIYRNVWLIATNFVHFDSYKGVYITTPEATTENAYVNISYDFATNFFSAKAMQSWKKDVYAEQKVVTKKLIVRSIITDKNGNEIAQADTEREFCQFEAHNLLSQQIEILHPNLWSPSSPTIYYLKSEIICDGKVIDDQVTSFAIRKLEYIANKGMFINGESVKLKGVCLHEDAGSFGVAVPIEIWRYRLLKIKAMGCNAIRTAHNPFAPEFYDLCDTLGFLVLDEAFDEWTRGWPYNYTDNNQGKAENGYHLYFNQWGKTDLKAMLWRDRNHPSIIMYSIGNEIPDQLNANGYKIAQKLVAICHHIDPSRPVTSACDQYMTATNNGFIDALDISGYNYIDRHFKEEMYEPEHLKRPLKLCLGTETDKDIRNFIAYRDNNYVIGGFIWVGIDYFGESDKYPQRGWTGGLMDMAGFAKPEYYLNKSYWSDKPTVHIAVVHKQNGKSRIESKWNYKANDSLTINVYSNCDQVELFLNNKSLGRKTIDRNTYFGVWPIIYHEGTIKAIGYNSNKKVAEDFLTTASKATRIVAKPTKTILKANGQDISLIEIRLVDNNGVTVYDADDSVTVDVTGEGSLAGIDTGDMFYTGCFKKNTRKAYHGKLLVAIKSKKMPGIINVDLKTKRAGALNLKIKNVL
jgi:beta-galactosidase